VLISSFLLALSDLLCCIKKSGSDASLLHDRIGHADGAANGSSNGGRANRVYKKGQAVHWLKLILYITQLGAHLSVALYYMLQDSAGPESWRSVTVCNDKLHAYTCGTLFLAIAECDISILTALQFHLLYNCTDG
jgi:hypothetical protein